MSPERQRIAIAEACGWTACGQTLGCEPHGWPPNVRKPTTKELLDGNAPEPWDIPDYLNDLNAMNEAEDYLEDTTGFKSVHCTIRDYWITLMAMLNPGKKLWNNGEFLGDWADAIKVGSATAAQRAESFLRALDKWEEGGS